MTRTVTRLAIAAIVVLATPALALGMTPDKWHVAQARLSYPLYKPTQTLNYKISSFGYQACGGAKSKDSMYATYGTYKGVLGSKTVGFAVFEGSPFICSDHAEYTAQGTRTIGGVKAQLGVYCTPPAHCSLAQGVKNGYILLWKRGKTRIQMDSSHLTLASFLKVAGSLAPVK